MGSNGSKASSSSSRGRRDDRSHHRSKGKNRVFQSSCLGAPSGSHDNNVDNNASQVYEPCDKDNDDCTSFTEQNETESEQVKIGYSGKGDVDSSAQRCCISSNSGLEDWDSSVMAADSSTAGSSSIRVSLPQSLNPSSRFLSRFSFIPGNVSFRLSRASSLGSSRNLTVVDNDDGLHLMQPRSNGLADIVESSHALASLRNPVQHDEDISDNGWSGSQASHSSFNEGSNPYVSSTHDVGRDGHDLGNRIGMNSHSPRMHPEPGYNETGHTERRAGGREPVERNVRFSRTLSVGRLRDRVLRRSSLSELTFCPLQRETEMRDEGEIGERQISTVETGLSNSENNAVTSASTSGYSPSIISRSVFGIQDHDLETSRTREARYRDLLEHRSDFLERRRRIRSQVRALQRLGSRFENLSGHERSCILSGQHRTGRCTCRNSNHDTNSNDDSNARASISRIVMLAEALFEVLDEIHQQSVVLSSRPSVSSIGSVPAPNEVVDSLPVKLYSKLQKQQNEDAAQCYICLVEYEDGDSVRILPCHHEFHRTCIDKWLKEIHRVCPLCRGDICRSDSFSTEHEANNFAI